MWRIGILIVLITCSCIVGTFQSPHVLPKGKQLIGVGATYLYVGEHDMLFMPWPELYYRVGVGNNLDLGLRMPVIMVGGGDFAFIGYGDVKAQLIKKGDTQVAVDFATIFGSSAVNEISGAGTVIIPGVFIGYKSMYLGTQVGISSGGSNMRFTVGYIIPGRFTKNFAFSYWVSERVRMVTGEVAVEFQF